MTSSESGPLDEFWIEPMRVDDGMARLHAPFNNYAIAIALGRKDEMAISKREAEEVLAAIVARLPEKTQR